MFLILFLSMWVAKIWFLNRTEKSIGLRQALTMSSTLALSGLKKNVFSNYIVVEVVPNNIIVIP